MRKEYYIGIKEHLTQLEDIKHIDYNLNQYRQTGDDVVRITPAVYIGFEPMVWTQLPNGVQRAEQSFTTTLVSSTRYGDERDILDDNNIGHLSIENAIYRHLNQHRILIKDLSMYQNIGMDDVLMESIVRTNTTNHQQINNLVISKTTYKSTVFDYSDTAEWQQVLTQLKLDIKLEKKLPTPPNTRTLK